MRIAFYAPLNSPIEGAPSGDRRVAILLRDALRLAGHDVDVVSTFRSFDGAGDILRQQALRKQGLAIARDLLAELRSRPAGERAQLWFTYHLYYKAPDWLGPIISRSLALPYVVAEPSYAAKRATGPWRLGHEAIETAIRQATMLVCPSRDDIPALASLSGSAARVVHLPPFLDARPFSSARCNSQEHRVRIAAGRAIDPSAPWILAVAMMRPGDKLASYCELAQVLAHVKDLPWSVLVAGDGAARNTVEAAFQTAIPGRAIFMGELSQAALSELYAACDLLVWPAVNEAYGMALLEAQAAGLPVVSANTRGVPDVVRDGHTGLLAPGGDHAAMAALVRTLLTDPERRRIMGHAAAEFVSIERSLEVAAQRLTRLLSALVPAPSPSRPASPDAAGLALGGSEQCSSKPHLAPRATRKGGSR